MARRQSAFDRLEHHVEREYLARGYSPKRASYIGHAVAGQQALRRRRHNPSAGSVVLWGGVAVLGVLLAANLWKDLQPPQPMTIEVQPDAPQEPLIERIIE